MVRAHYFAPGSLDDYYISIVHYGVDSQTAFMMILDKSLPPWAGSSNWESASLAPRRFGVRGPVGPPFIKSHTAIF